MRTDNEKVDAWITRLNATGHADAANFIEWLRQERNAYKSAYEKAHSNFKEGDYVRKTKGDYEAEGHLVGDAILIRKDDGTIVERRLLAIKKIVSGQLLHIVNPAHLVEAQESTNG